jgi:hypothetical protein
MREKTLRFAALALLLAAAGCGPKETVYSVMGINLKLAEQSHGQGDYFCETLTNGQFQVVLSDFAVCDPLKTFAPMESQKANLMVFHGGDGANMRIIFPSQLKITQQNWKVAANPACKDNAAGAEAVVFFSKNSGGASKYETEVQADSGTITVTSTKDQWMATRELTGKFDVTIAGSKLSGSFAAPFCDRIVPGIGK